MLHVAVQPNVRRVCQGAAVCLLVLSGVSTAAADPLTFTKIVDTSTPPPGGGRFISFAGELGNDDPVPPSIDGQSVTFTARVDVTHFGVYLWQNGSIGTVADFNTPVPNRTGTFIGFRTPSVSEQHVAFIGFSASGQGEGIYFWSGGTLSRVADPSTQLPDNGGHFVATAFTPVSGDTVYFQNSDAALYSWRNGAYTVVADAHTPVPAGTGTFDTLNTNPMAANGNVAFWGGSGMHHGIYASIGGNLVRIADDNTTVPGESATFLNFSNVYVGFDGQRAAFSGLDRFSNWGIYTWQNGTLQRVFTTGQPANEDVVNAVSVNGRHIAFAIDGGPIYSDINASLQRIIGGGDTLNGKTINFVTMGPEALSGDELVFAAKFTDGSSGIFVVPEPASISLLTIFGLPLLYRRASR